MAGRLCFLPAPLAGGLSRSSVFQADALEVSVTVPDGLVVGFDRIAIVGTLPFLFLAFHADDILVVML